MLTEMCSIEACWKVVNWKTGREVGELFADVLHDDVM
jgi:hypothetical protein